MLSDKAVFLQGIVRKDGDHWKVEVPVINVRSEHHSVVKCMKDIESFIKKGIQEDVQVDMRIFDGGILHVTTSNNEAFRNFIFNMTA